MHMTLIEDAHAYTILHGAIIRIIACSNMQINLDTGFPILQRFLGSRDHLRNPQLRLHVEHSAQRRAGHRYVSPRFWAVSHGMKVLATSLYTKQK